MFCLQIENHPGFTEQRVKTNSWWKRDNATKNFLNNEKNFQENGWHLLQKEQLQVSSTGFLCVQGQDIRAGVNIWTARASL